MKINAKIKNILFQSTAILIVLGAALYMLAPQIAKYTLAIGATGYIICLFTTPYPGQSIRGKRLFNMQVFAALLIAVSAFLMFMNHNLWILILFIAAILTLYSSTMIPKALKDELPKKDSISEKDSVKK